jgi:hypothetical protein
MLWLFFFGTAVLLTGGFTQDWVLACTGLIVAGSVVLAES